MSEILFYQIERRPLEQVLIQLLRKTLERGQRAVVQAGSRERVDALDAQLWTFADESFLPHGTAADGHADRQPIYLTDDADNPNRATIRFHIDGAEFGRVDDYDRVVYLFDGALAGDLEMARNRWRDVKAAGLSATYWRQSEAGRWEQQA